MVKKLEVELIISIIALSLSCTALIFIARNFWRKSGIQIRGMYCISSSTYCNDKYVSNLTIENVKDRSVVVFKIYLFVGKNYYIEIEDFEDNPLILKPYEAYSKQYDPLDFYSVSTRKINLNKLLDSRKIKSRLVLSTSEGRYEVKEWIKRWSPITDFFKNHMTAIIIPMRGTYKEKCYGSNAKYIVEFKTEDGKEETIPIYPRDYAIVKFRKFRLTKDSLESKENLEELLYQQAIEGNLNCVDIKIHDIAAWRVDAYKDHSEEIEAEYYNWFKYKVLGRLYTYISDKKLKYKNRKNRKAANQSLKRDG